MNTDKQKIQAAVEDTLRRRLASQRLTNAKAKHEELAFIVGASAALQAVFGEAEDKMTDYIPPLWIIAPMTGRRILDA